MGYQNKCCLYWLSIVVLAVASGGPTCSKGDSENSESEEEPSVPATSAASAPEGGYAYFPREAVWYRDVSADPLDQESGAVIAYLDATGWGTGVMRIDFSIEVLEAPANTPVQAFTPTGDHFLPDCDLDPVPIPPGGALEGETGYECRGNGDCHLIVVDGSEQRLYEMWRACRPASSIIGR